MRITIPQDWDGETWACVQVRWPDSPQWFAVLAGLISQVTRGWSWQETGGIGNDLPEVLATADEILARNWPWRKCDGSMVPPPPGQDSLDSGSLGGVGGAFCCWEDCMGCFDISRMLRIRNGNLEALDACCQWVVVGSLDAADNTYQPEDHPLYDPDADPPQTWYRCGKATAVIGAIADMGKFIWDNYDVDPWEFETRMRGQFPQYSLSRFAMYEAWLQWTSIALIGYNKANSFGDTLKELAICKLVDDLEPTPNVSDDELDHVLSSVNSAASDLYPGSGLPPTRGDITAQWETVQDIIGKGDLKTVMLLGASDDSAVCDCPEILPEPPEELEWFHSWDFTVGQQGFVDPGATAEYVAGQGWRSAEYGGYDVNLQINGNGKARGANPTIEGAVTFIRFTYSCDAWVSGYKSNNIRVDGISPTVQIELEPGTGSGLVQTWNGYQVFYVDNGETSNCRMVIARDECGTGAYYGTAHKLEIGGMGYDPFSDPA